MPPDSVPCVRLAPHAIHAVDAVERGAESFGQVPMRAFREKMQVDIAEQRREGIRVFGLLYRVAPVDAQTVGLLAGTDEDLGIADRQQRDRLLAVQQLHAHRARLEGTHDDAMRSPMRSQERERVWMTPFGDHQRLGDVLRVVHVHRAAANLAKPAAGTSIQSGRLLAS